MVVITKQEAHKLIEGLARSGKIFTVQFTKRSNGELRMMNCRGGVKKGVKGVGMSYNPRNKGLVPVYDMLLARKTANPHASYRQIPVEGVLLIRANGEEYEVA